jgi:hypothetical protein
MRFSGGTAFLVLGVAAGYISAMQAISRAGVSAAADGSKWQMEWVNPKDPYNLYALAHFKSDGLLPPDRGSQFYTRVTDDDGKALRGDCSYRLSGPDLPVRWWSLAVAPVGAPTSAVSTNSGETLITGDARLDITLSRRAVPGNWLSLPDSNSLKATLVLHETTEKNKKGGTLVLPSVAKVACE